MLHLSQPLVVASLTSDLVERAREADERGADAVEVRLDLYGSDGDPVDSVRDLADSDVDLPVIATNRPTWEGGDFEGDEDARVEILSRAAEYADAVDIELNASDEVHGEVLDAADDAEATLIASYHDFDSTPSYDEIRGVLSEAAEIGIPKLAVYAESRDDVLRLLEATLEHDGDVCTIAMGEKGSHSRVVAPLYGSRLTYASLGDDSTAPGQLTVSEVRQTLDILLR
ncbi:MAG: type I 3-dehydroquinate dehydratase [Halobacteria archaeon]|nr:type I 3-dehydroquinate dehydratase [Halobacteria archaeon]